MWKIVMVLVLTALAVFAARLAYDAAISEAHTGAAAIEAGVPTALTPPFMYAGIRG